MSCDGTGHCDHSPCPHEDGQKDLTSGADPITCEACGGTEFKELGWLGKNLNLRCVSCGMDTALLEVKPPSKE